MEQESDSESPEKNCESFTMDLTTFNNKIFNSLIKHQLRDVPDSWRLNINDMKRISSFIDSDPFDIDNCCIWKGSIAGKDKKSKSYINFYFKNKKIALHRILYSNFIKPLTNSVYLKFNCDNKGICCNIYHLEKHQYINKKPKSNNKEN
jgi:hypothetical protein